MVDMTQFTYEAALIELKRIEADVATVQPWQLGITPFLIRITKPVVFRQRTASGKQCVGRIYLPGDVLVATARNARGEWYVHSYGGIYYSEAEPIDIVRQPEDHVASLGYN